VNGYAYVILVSSMLNGSKEWRHKISKQEKELPLKESIRSSLGLPQTLKKSLTGKMMKVRYLPNQGDVPEIALLQIALQDSLANNITQRELTEMCIKWSYHYVFERGGYLPTQYPEKPLDVMRFYNEPKIKREKAKEGLRNMMREKLFKWNNAVSRARTQNCSDKIWLEKMLDYYRYKKNSERIQQINKRLSLHEEVC